MTPRSSPRSPPGEDVAAFVVDQLEERSLCVISEAPGEFLAGVDEDRTRVLRAERAA
jgi:hypothetical protein